MYNPFERKIFVTEPGDTSFNFCDKIPVRKFIAENQRMEQVDGKFAEGVEVPWQEIVCKCGDYWYTPSPFTGELILISHPGIIVKHCILALIAKIVKKEGFKIVADYDVQVDGSDFDWIADDEDLVI